MLGVRLEPELEASLTALAKRTRRSKSDIAREAIGQYARRQDFVYLAEARRQSMAAAQTENPENLTLLDDLAADLVNGS